MGIDPRELDSDIVKFIDQHIDDIPELEALLLLHDTAPKRWDTASLSYCLYVLQEEAEFILAKLCRKSFVIGVESQGYYFNAEAPEATVVVRVAAAYRTQLTAVTRLVHDKPPVGVREFARAFQIKKDGK